MTCARSLPSCRGRVAIYRQALRPAHERHRLCDQCIHDLSGAPLYLHFIEVEPVLPTWRRRSLVKDFTGGAA